MRYYYKPTEAELMEEAKDALRKRRDAMGGRVLIADTTAPSEFQTFLAAREARRRRSLQCCHHYAFDEKRPYAPPPDSGAFVPAMAARIDDDRNLTDGSRRTGHKIMELTYKRNRVGRSLEVTVSYLATALHRCPRTIQRYLRELEREGYIKVAVVAGHRSRLCVGLIVTLLDPLFPRHHRQKWPEKPGKSGATILSQNERIIDYRQAKGRIFTVSAWAERCMDGVFRALMTKIGPLPPLKLLGDRSGTASP